METMALHKLTDAGCRKALKQVGSYNDGGGLSLEVRKVETGSWILRYTSPVTGRARDMGLGSYVNVSLKDARDMRQEAIRLLRDGKDPIEVRDKAKASPTQPTIINFAEAARRYIEQHESGWANPIHRQQWKSTIETYANPWIGGLAVDEITKEHILQILKPIWIDKHETAKRLRGRMEVILQWCIAHAYRTGDNPAELKNLKIFLPKRSKDQKQVRHHPAMPYDQVPAFMARLSEDNGTVSAALQFIVLTAVRTNEALQADWKDIDFDNRLWVIPAKRMKMGKDHRVPLSDAAMAILKTQYMHGHYGFVFKGQDNEPVTNTAVRHALHRAWHGDGEVTVHGMRSSFRDWALDVADARWETAEAALAHTNGDETERAYRRGDALEARKKLMQSWASWCRGLKQSRKASRTVPDQPQDAAPSH
jgi:integrase